MNFEINEKIEEQTGIFFNPQIHLLADFLSKEKLVQPNVIASLKSFVYAADVEELIPALCLPRIQKCLFSDIELAENDRIKLEKASETICNSPTLDFDFHVYRGFASMPILKVGDVFTHKNFLYTSLHFCYARQFLQDTSECYDENGHCTFYNAKKSSSQPVMLQIRVRAGTHFFETKTNFNFPTNEARSEVILNCNTQLLIENVETCAFARCVGEADTFLLYTASTIE
jgi:hypothetical protein